MPVEVRDLTVRFADFAREARGLDPARWLDRWAERVGGPHGDVYEACFRRWGGRGRFAAALPSLLERAERLVAVAEQAAAALEALQDPVAEELGGTPPRLFCVLLVGDGSEAAWIAPFRGRMTLFLAAEALPAERPLLRALVARELARYFHLARSLGIDNRAPLPDPDPLASAPLGLYLLGYGLGALLAVVAVPGLALHEYVWFGGCPDGDGWLARCRREEARWATALRPHLALAAAAPAARRWLDGGEAGEAGDAPPRVGPYLALRAAERLGAEYPAADLAAWPPARAVAALDGVLGRLARADGR